MENKEIVDTKKAHRFVINDKNSFEIFGVVEVLEVMHNFLSVRLTGDLLSIKGTDMSIKSLDIEKGFLDAVGIVSEVKYQSKAPKTSLIKKLFK